MDIYKVDLNFENPILIDEYTSLIWTDRYSDAGDFELVLPIDSLVASTINYEDILSIDASKHSMIVESVDIQSDEISGKLMKVTGSSLESILQRRIIWGQVSLKGPIESCIKKLLDINIINPEDPLRKIPNFIFEPCNNPEIDKINIEAQYTGDNLYEVISNLCYENGIGFKICLNDKNQFIFKLYQGKNRSYDQTSHPFVIFSTEFDNLTSSDFYGSTADYKNVALVAGEGEGSSRKSISVGNVEAKGLDRREMFSDARDISSDTIDGQIPEEEYFSFLIARGLKDLSDFQMNESFDGKCDANGMFKFNKDFFVGDIVQIEDSYGHTGGAYITEMIISDDQNGYTIYPTFELV